MKRFFAALTVTALTVVSVGATSALADTGPSDRGAVQRMIAGKTGATADEVSGSRTVDGHRVTKGIFRGEALQTYVQDRSDGFAVMAVLKEGQTSATFAGLLKAGQRLEHSQNGGLAVLDGNNLVASVDAPWAVDAKGRSLRTSYRIDGSAIVQNVDTTDATFPIVVDPSIKTGFYIVPVFYVQYTWTETNYINTHIAYSAPAVALLCSKTGAAAPFCAFFGAMFIVDVTNVTRSAIANKKCLKQRLPANTGAIGIPAYDSYYVTCTS